MKCMVINLGKARRALPFIRIVALLLVFAGIVILVSENIYRGSEYLEAMHAASEKNTVIIDAGHGGEDSGTVGVSGVLEKDLNLQISLTLGNMLSQRGYAVIYTRTEDKLLYTEEENIKGIRKISDLKNRCKIAAEYPNALFISIHQNSYGSSKYSGLQVYHKPSDSSSIALARYIQSGVKNALQQNNNRAVKSGEKIYLLENCVSNAVLIECGFLSNPEECEKLSQKEYQKELCSAIICGIIDYKENFEQ